MLKVFFSFSPDHELTGKGSDRTGKCLGSGVPVPGASHGAGDVFPGACFSPGAGPGHIPGAVCKPGAGAGSCSRPGCTAG